MYNEGPRQPRRIAPSPATRPLRRRRNVQRQLHAGRDELHLVEQYRSERRTDRLSQRRSDRPEHLTVRYSDVQGGGGGHFPEHRRRAQLGSGNVDADPLFATRPTATIIFRPARRGIDSADGRRRRNWIWTAIRATDHPDMPNVGIGPPWADMGAYELQGDAPPAGTFYVNDSYNPRGHLLYGGGKFGQQRNIARFSAGFLCGRCWMLSIWSGRRDLCRHGNLLRHKPHHRWRIGRRNRSDRLDAFQRDKSRGHKRRLVRLRLSKSAAQAAWSCRT